MPVWRANSVGLRRSFAASFSVWQVTSAQHSVYMKNLPATHSAVGNFRALDSSESISFSPNREPDRLMPWNRVGLWLLVFTTAVLVPCVLVAMALCEGPESTRLWWLSESGPVEMASGWGYVLLAFGLVALGAMRLTEGIGKGRTAKGSSFHFVMPESSWQPVLLASCLASLAAREFDWHNSWTTRCVLKTRFYIDPAISIAEKLAASAVLFLIGFLLVSTIRVYGREFLDRLRRGTVAAWLTAIGIVLLPISKTLDSGPSLLKRHLGVDPSNMHRFLGSVEELMELAIPALFLMAAIAAVWSCHRIRTAREDSLTFGTVQK